MPFRKCSAPSARAVSTLFVMNRGSSFFPVAVLSFVALAAACVDESGSGGGGEGGSGTKAETTGGETTTSTTDSTTEASTSTGMVDPCEGAETVSFANDVSPIFAQKCATTGCHTGALPDGGLDLDALDAHEETVGTATQGCSGDRVRVIAGDPAESYLWDKINGTDLCGTSKKMPPATKPQLTDEEKRTITSWICGGALND